MRILQVLMAGMAALLASTGWASEPQVGEKAPPLSIEGLLHAPDGTNATWESLAGKVVVVEFWATWCGPCIAAIPHLNDLAEQFKDDDVVFLSITVNEDVDVVEPFLRRRPMSTWIGLDPDGSTATSYGVTGIPRTFVVGRDGRIIAVTYPTQLEMKHLEAALAGEAVDLPADGNDADLEVVPVKSATESAMVEAWLRPAAGELKRGMSGANEVSFTNYTAENLVANSYNGRMAGARLTLEANLPEGKFDLYVRVPPERAFQVDELVWETVAFSFGLVRYKETRETQVFLLEAIEGEEEKRPAVEPGKPSAIQAFEDPAYYGLDIKGTYPSHLAQYIDLGMFDTPIITEMERGDQFDVDLKIPRVEAGVNREHRQLAAANVELARYGLRLVSAVRPVEFTVVANRGSYSDEHAGATTRPGGPPPANK